MTSEGLQSQRIPFRGCGNKLRQDRPDVRWTGGHLWRRVRHPAHPTSKTRDGSKTQESCRDRAQRAAPLRCMFTCVCL